MQEGPVNDYRQKSPEKQMTVEPVDPREVAIERLACLIASSIPEWSMGEVEHWWSDLTEKIS